MTKPQFKVNVPELIVYHCTATPADMDVDVAMVNDWHQKRGFYDIGYHFLIKRDGTLEVGRPIERYGAHAAGFNKDSVAIAMAGGVDKNMHPEDNFTDDQYAMLYGTSTSLLINYPTIIEIVGHYQLPNVAKACPSFDVDQFVARHVSLTQLMDANYARLYSK